MSSTARMLIEDVNNRAFLSVASCWEMAIKYKIGKLTLTEPFHILIPREIKDNDFQLLPISYTQVEQTISLDLHHKDPFDRLLIAQALAESMPFVSNENIFDQYTSLDHRW